MPYLFRVWSAMATLNDVHITFEIEPIIKVICLESNCKNNLFKMGIPHCNLKNIVIDKDHVCRDYDPMVNQEVDEHAST